MATTKKQELPSYKGKPLVRSGNILYYGDPAEKYIAMMQIISTEQLEDITLANRISVQIISTDDSVLSSQRIVKKTEKNGLYNALNIASIWLERTINNG